MEKRKVIGFYDYTVVLTYLGMVFAFMGIIKVMNTSYSEAVICLMLAGVCDMFDGMVASTKIRNTAQKHFGIQIDSLCDLISFGVLPALFVYMISGKNPVVGLLSCAYALCGLIRLAYFNVEEYERQKRTTEKREFYLGLPITTAAIALPLGYLLYTKISVVGTWIFFALTVFLGIGFITGIEIKKPNFAGKVIMVAFGILEMLGVFVLSGADIL